MRIGPTSASASNSGSASAGSSPAVTASRRTSTRTSRRSALNCAVEFAHLRIALGSVDERGHARRVRRLLEQAGDLFEESGDPLAQRAGLGHEDLRFQGSERVLDERELAGPVAVDRALAHPGAGRDRLDREGAVADEPELLEHSFEDHSPGALDARIDIGFHHGLILAPGRPRREPVRGRARGRGPRPPRARPRFDGGARTGEPRARRPPRCRGKRRWPG